jgi:hypothetical protein
MKKIASAIAGTSFFLQQTTNIKNGVFWDVTLCGSFDNRRFGGT